MNKIKTVLEKNQVLIYFSTIILGALIGLTIEGTLSFAGSINPALAIMLFATFLQVPLTEFGSAFRDIRFISALLLTNFIIMPIITAGLVQFLPNEPMIKFAVSFVLLAPCIDYVISFTQIGHGNAKRLLAMTPLLLVVQILLLPFYLNLFLGNNVTKLIKFEPFIHAFLQLIVLPLVIAGGIQLLANKNKSVARLMHTLSILPVPATALVLFLVLSSVMPQISLAKGAALRVVPIYIAFGMLAPITGWLIARSLHLEITSIRAVSFSASYRNSFVILPFAFIVPGGVPLLPAVILTQTMVELCLLPFYIRLIPRLSSL